MINSNNDRMSKIEELRSMLRRDKFHIIWACMKCLENEMEPTAERIALYSFNDVEFVRRCEEWWRELLV